MKYILLIFIFVGFTGCSTFIVKNGTDEKISVDGQILKPNECVEYTAIPLGDSPHEVKTVGDNPELIEVFVGYLGRSHLIVKPETEDKFTIQDVDTKPDCQKIIKP